MKNLTLLITGTLLAMASQSSLAAVELNKKGVTVMPPAGSTGAVMNDTPSPVRESSKKGGHTLRCWQYGRLLYESSGYSNDINHGSAVVVSKTDGDKTTVVDLKDAFCMLSKN